MAPGTISGAKRLCAESEPQAAANAQGTSSLKLEPAALRALGEPGLQGSADTGERGMAGFSRELEAVEG